MEVIRDAVIFTIKRLSCPAPGSQLYVFPTLCYYKGQLHDRYPVISGVNTVFYLLTHRLKVDLFFNKPTSKTFENGDIQLYET